MTRLRPSGGLFCYTEVMATKREIKIDKLVVDNYATEEILEECVHQLSDKMTEEALGEKMIYWKIIEALESKLCGQKRTKVL